MNTNSPGKRWKYVLLLAAATPGIPEYLTGSWTIWDLTSRPVNFLFFLLMNLGMYTTGALLIREFAVAFRKGWVSVFILGCAYGIIEEAIALHTYFQIVGPPVAYLGSYGRFAGVDWVWAFGLAVFHAIFSITLPILLVSTAYPELSGKRITRNIETVPIILIYSFSVLVLNFVTNLTSSRPVPTSIEYLLFTLIPLALVILSYAVPAGTMSFRGKEGTGLSPFFVLGFLVYPVYNVFAFIPVNPILLTRISPVLDITIHLFLFGAIALAVVLLMPKKDNTQQKFALSAGIVSSLIVASVRYELNGTAPYIALLDIIAIIFLSRLWIIVNENRKLRGHGPEGSGQI